MFLILKWHWIASIVDSLEKQITNPPQPREEVISHSKPQHVRIYNTEWRLSVYVYRYEIHNDFQSSIL